VTNEILGAARTALREAIPSQRWPDDPGLHRLLRELTVPPDSAASELLAAAATAFELDAGETRALALVAAVEIDARFGALFARMQGDASLLRPSVGTLMELAGLRDIAAFLPTARLRRHMLIDLEGDIPMIFRSVRCRDEVWSRLAGVGSAPPLNQIDHELDTLVLPPALREAVRDAGRWLARPPGAGGLIVVWGRPGGGRHAVAGAVLAEAGRRGLAIDAEQLATSDRARELERDARWHGLVPIITSDSAVPSQAVRGWLDRAQVPRVWIQGEVPDWLVESRVATRVLHVPPLAAEDRAALWRNRLASAGAELEIEPLELASRFRFGPGRIARVVELAREHGGPPTLATIIGASRATRRAGIGLLAERLTPRRRDELVVAPALARELGLAIGWAAAHAPLYGAWGLSSGVARARGVTCLFAGPPGTGKTLAAQVLAGAIDRDLFRVDLAQAVSKWLGETEKNLGRIFDEAEDAGAVLFFDEADALFARRTQVRDSTDRYANLETGYLLQRLESHDGVVVLATNRRQDIDGAFLRRFEVVIEFTSPGICEREQLWQRHLPARDRCAADVDAGTLARLFELSGGQIRNAIMTSVASTAVDEGGGLIAAPPRLAMFHLIGGATRELLRTGRLVNPADYGEWAEAVRAAFATQQVTRP
jgi:hypothetical protein